MRRRVGYIALSAALIAVVGGLAVAQAATDITTPETLVLTVHEVKVVPINLSGTNAAPGDGVMLRYTVFDETDTTQLGTEHAQCTIQPGKNWSLCTGAIFITGRGQIAAEGAIQGSSGIFDLPITGGTGDFANVRGYAHVEAIDQTTSTYTLNLLP